MLEGWNKLFERLEKEEVFYCAFKHLYKIDQVLDTGGEIDLYCPDLKRIGSALKSLGWLKLKRPLTDMKGLEHWYSVSDCKLLHLHIYGVLRTGHSWSKEAILAPILSNSTNIYHGVRICSKSIEQGIIRTRHELKNSTWIGRVVFKKDSKYVSELKRFDRNYEAWPILKRNKLGALIVYIYFVRWLIFRLIRPRRRLSRGKFIAVTGSDGTGKTSLLEGIEDILCPVMRLKKIHVGKPVPIVYSGRGGGSEARQLIRKQILILLRLVKIFANRVLINHGYLIISDRYVSKSRDGMDSMYVSITNSWLCNIQESFNRIWIYLLPKPDVVIRLVADLDTVIARDKSRAESEGESLIRQRFEKFQITQYPGVEEFLVDTSDLSKSNVLDLVLKNI